LGDPATREVAPVRKLKRLPEIAGQEFHGLRNVGFARLAHTIGLGRGERVEIHTVAQANANPALVSAPRGKGLVASNGQDKSARTTLTSKRIATHHACHKCLLHDVIDVHQRPCSTRHKAPNGRFMPQHKRLPGAAIATRPAAQEFGVDRFFFTSRGLTDTTIGARWFRRSTLISATTSLHVIPRNS